jgi:hypothetical protein
MKGLQPCYHPLHVDMQGHSVFVAAHTSAGKTAVAEYAIELRMKAPSASCPFTPRAGAQRVCGRAHERG